MTVSPDAFFNLERLITRLSYGDPSLEALTRILEPLASDTVLALLFVGFFAVVVPLIEELVKPAAVMLLLRRPITVRDGFVLGAISGAGFGLLENLTQGASAEGWAPLVVARLGTTAVHMVTAGLTGAALVDAKETKRYGRLLAAYLTAVVIHGLWNAMAVLPLLAELSDVYPQHLALTPWMVLAVLGAGSVVLLATVNRRLRVQLAPD
jgi:RsiW-degrading membrane proteinase PrsW (M82 family)